MARTDATVLTEVHCIARGNLQFVSCQQGAALLLVLLLLLLMLLSVVVHELHAAADYPWEA